PADARTVARQPHLDEPDLRPSGSPQRDILVVCEFSMDERPAPEKTARFLAVASGSAWIESGCGVWMSSGGGAMIAGSPTSTPRPTPSPTPVPMCTTGNEPMYGMDVVVEPRGRARFADNSLE